MHRLLAEIRLLVEKPKYSDVLASKSLRIHAPPAKPNCTAWLGGQTRGFISISITGCWTEGFLSGQNSKNSLVDEYFCMLSKTETGWPYGFWTRWFWKNIVCGLSNHLESPLCIHIVLCSTGAIFGALQDILGSRSVSRDYYNQTGRIPDWCCLSSPPPESLYEAGKTPPPLMKRAFSTEK